MSRICDKIPSEILIAGHPILSPQTGDCIQTLKTTSSEPHIQILQGHEGSISAAPETMPSRVANKTPPPLPIYEPPAVGETPSKYFPCAATNPNNSTHSVYMNIYEETSMTITPKKVTRELSSIPPYCIFQLTTLNRHWHTHITT